MATFLGTTVAVYDNAGNVIYSTPNGTYAQSPLDVTATLLGVRCSGTVATCSAELVSYFTVTDNRSFAIEGGAVDLKF